MKLSIIIAVLESYEIVRREMLYYNTWLSTFGDDIEFILMDDDSDPPITVAPVKFNLRIIPTHDPRPWAQPAARNLGAAISKGEYLFMTDIDHFMTPEIVADCLKFTGDKMMFKRRQGLLDDSGRIITDEAALISYGLREDKRGGHVDQHYNTFCMRRTVFVDMLRGYDDKFVGKYGGDDTDLSERYRLLCRRDKLVAPAQQSPNHVYVFPDPKSDKLKLFHSLRRSGFTKWN
jgi:hypothetical protein